MYENKVLIVEGNSDRKRERRVLDEPIEIICTNGTISSYHLEELLTPYEQFEMYVFLDADEDGEKTRALFKREYPLAIHLYTEKVYKEVETTPYSVLAAVLLAADFEVRAEFLI